MFEIKFSLRPTIRNVNYEIIIYYGNNDNCIGLIADVN